jgi:cellulose biosynthesis protein BcsQ
MNGYPYVITVSSEKGGVGKTTLATNLAIFLRALDEDLPVTVFSLDNHFTVDRMFEHRGQPSRGSVTDLLLETPGRELLHTGQYGVNYIPSSAALADLRGAVRGPMVFARLLARSGIPGILIIDTRPDLDIMTQNALYAADRVIIPVKDMASLENCRNIFALFDKRGMDRRSLSLIPCLVDERIKFDGMFADQKTLLKAYAINRGYRCFDTYISKSPKVESLNTNPDGKIYPVLTHGRGTDVYGQFFQLARTVLDEYRATAEPRAYLFHQWQTAEDERQREAFYARLSGLKGECLLCGRPTPLEGSRSLGYYYETSDGGACGFLEEECFFGFLLASVFGAGREISPDDPTWHILRESARGSAFAFRPLDNGQGQLVEIGSFDREGNVLLRRSYPLREFEGGILRRERNRLFTLVNETLAGYGGKFREAFLLVQPVDPATPEKVLQDDGYREMKRLQSRIAEQFI